MQVRNTLAYRSFVLAVDPKPRVGARRERRGPVDIPPVRAHHACPEPTRAQLLHRAELAPTAPTVAPSVPSLDSATMMTSSVEELEAPPLFQNYST